MIAWCMHTKVLQFGSTHRLLTILYVHNYCSYSNIFIKIILRLDSSKSWKMKFSCNFNLLCGVSGPTPSEIPMVISHLYSIRTMLRGTMCISLHAVSVSAVCYNTVQNVWWPHLDVTCMEWKALGTSSMFCQMPVRSVRRDYRVGGESMGRFRAFLLWYYSNSRLSRHGDLPDDRINCAPHKIHWQVHRRRWYICKVTQDFLTARAKLWLTYTHMHRSEWHGKTSHVSTQMQGSQQGSKMKRDGKSI